MRPNPRGSGSESKNVNYSFQKKRLRNIYIHLVGKVVTWHQFLQNLLTCHARPLGGLPLDVGDGVHEDVLHLSVVLVAHGVLGSDLVGVGILLSHMIVLEDKRT